MTSTIYKIRIQDLLILLLFISLLLVYPACQSLEEETMLLMSVDHLEYVSEGSYKIYGTLASMRKEELTDFGICWSDSPNPDIAGFFKKLETPLTQGEFCVTVSDLSPNTTYYFRAFAQTNTLMEYSPEKEFTTRPAAEDMVMDVLGNIYKTVKIGKQVWMAENLRTTMYSDRTPIPYAEDSAVWFHFTRESLGYCWYGNALSQGFVYGALYSWPAATRAFEGISTIEEGVQGVCPDGWHLPSDDEWKELEMYLGMSQVESDAAKWRGTDQGGKLKQEGIQNWYTPNSGAVDEVAFKALPGGYRHGSAAFLELGKTARFWTSTQNGYGYAWYRGVDYDRTDVYRDFSGVYRGHSVRCVKDD